MAGAGALLIGLLAGPRLLFTVATGQLAGSRRGTYGLTYLLLIAGRAARPPHHAADAAGGRGWPPCCWPGRSWCASAPMALPQTVIIDLPWHMKWLHELLAGHWESLYFPGG